MSELQSDALRVSFAVFVEKRAGDLCAARRFRVVRVRLSGSSESFGAFSRVSPVPVAVSRDHCHEQLSALRFSLREIKWG